MKTVYLSLGSNLGSREQMLQEAVNLIHSRQIRVRRVSSVYETEPQERRNQRWFLNLVLEAETDLFPQQLLMRIGKIERDLGRRKMTPKGPRAIDIDILFYGSFVVETRNLRIPHARLTERRFVLAPMAELAPELRHPVNRRTMRELLGETGGQPMRRVGFQPVIPGSL